MPTMTGVAAAVLALAVAQGQEGGTGVVPLKFASLLNRSPGGTMTAAAGTQLSQWIRYPAIIGSSDQNALVLSFSARTMNPGGEVNTGAYNITQATLVRTTVAAFTPITFGGLRNKQINSGDIDVHCDDILPSAFGLTKFPIGETYFINVQLTVAAAGVLMPQCATLSGVTGQWLMWYDPATFTIQNTDITGLPTFSGSGFAFNNTGAYIPILLGRPANTSAKVWCGIGDSIMQNTGDTVTVKGIGGFFQRALVDADLVSNPHSGCNFGHFGQNSDQWNGATMALAMLKYSTHIVEEYGTNLSTVTEQASSKAIWVAAQTAGCKVLRTMLIAVTTATQSTTSLTSVGTAATLVISTGTLPAVGSNIAITGATPAAYNGTFVVTGSAAGTINFTLGSSPGVAATGTILWSDLWESKLNQTKAAPWLPGGDRVTFNTWLQGRSIPADFDALLDFVAITSDASDRYLWLTDGVTSNLKTVDGTHPSNQLHIDMGTALRTQMALM